MKINSMPLNTYYSLKKGMTSVEQRFEEAEKLQDTYRTFVGESYFGQLLKSMQSTVGKPAYFHGGQAEEIFRGQLYQMMAQDMTKASADQIADPMFKQQFPRQAEILKEAAKQQEATLTDLHQLRRS